MNDELDPTGRLLGEQLHTIATTLPVRDDGRMLVDATITRRRRSRRATWAVAAAALLVVVVAAGAQLRRSDTDPYVDTTTTTTTVPVSEPGAGPDSVAAEVPPLFVPGNGYEWRLAAWRGSYGSAMSVTDGDHTSFVVTVIASPPSQWAPASPTPDSIQTATLEGRQVEMKVSTQSGESSYTVEIEPGTTLTVRVRDTDETMTTTRVTSLLASLRRATQSELTAAALPPFPSSQRLVAPGQSTLIDSQREDPSVFTAGTPEARDDSTLYSAATLAIWDERLGWGQILLTASPSPKSVAAVGTEVEVRGTTGRMVAVGGGDGTRSMRLEWQENGVQYSMGFAVELGAAGAIRVADALRTPTDAELQTLWFPTWRPAELPPLGSGTPS